MSGKRHQAYLISKSLPFHNNTMFPLKKCTSGCILHQWKWKSVIIPLFLPPIVLFLFSVVSLGLMGLLMNGSYCIWKIRDNLRPRTVLSLSRGYICLLLANNKDYWQFQITLIQCFSKCPLVSSISITCALVRNASSQGHPRPTQSEYTVRVRHCSLF